MPRPRTYKPSDFRKTDVIEQPDGQIVTAWHNVRDGGMIYTDGTNPADNPNAIINAQTLPMLSDKIPENERDESSFENLAEDQENDAIAQVTALLQESVGNNARVRVSKKTADDRFAYAADYTPEQFSEPNFLDLLRKRFGSGTYEFRLYGNHPSSGKFSILSRKQMYIADDHSAIASSSQPGGIETLARVMQENNERMMQFIGQALSSRVDPKEQLKDMLGMMVMMREAMGIGNQQAPQRSSIGEIVDAVKELRSVSRELDPENNSDPLTKAVETFSPLITQAMQQTKQETVVHQPQQIAFQSAPDQRSKIISRQKVEEVNIPQMLLNDEQKKLFEYAKTILKKLNETTEDSDGDLANDLYDHAPDEVLDFLLEDESIDTLIAFMPEFAPHRQRIVDIRYSLVDWTNEDSAQNESSSSAPGDSDNSGQPTPPTDAATN